MPLGGTPILWDEASPAGSEKVGLGDDRIRSTKTSVRNALDSEHFFDSSSSTAGAHRPGSARAFYGAQSAVSASMQTADAGRLMLTSDTTRLFSVDSRGTGLVGAGPMSLSLDAVLDARSVLTMPTLPLQRWSLMAGRIASGGTFQVTFPNSGFSASPMVFLSVDSTSLPSDGRIARLLRVEASTFSGFVQNSENGDAVDGVDVMWLALGLKAQ